MPLLRALSVLLAVAFSGHTAKAADTTDLQIVGGLGGVTQFTQFEEPFWSEKIGSLSGGRIRASIRAFDQSGLRGQDMLQLLRLGVVPFGTVILSLAAGDEPELSAVDLPGMNPDMAAMRASLAAYRPHIAEILGQRYGVELLGIYVYPAQVIYCDGSFAGLADLKGRRVRTSSVAQSEFVSALGAVPVIIPFSEMVKGVTDDVVDCAITGTLSGNEIGLSDVTTHVHAMAISWGISFFGANRAAWEALAPDLRDIVRSGVKDLEQEIWDSAERETARGLACDTGTPDCGEGRRSAMTLVPVTAGDDELRRKLLVEAVLPRWIDRCGGGCAAAWNKSLAAMAGAAIPSP